MANIKISELSTIPITSNTWFEVSANGATGKVNTFSIGATVTIPRDVTITTSLTNATVSGVTANLMAGENLNFGQLCYVKSDSKMWRANSSTIATGPASFVASANIIANVVGQFLAVGSANNSAWSLTPGTLLYLANNLIGGFTTVAPAGSNEIIQTIGQAITGNVIYFRPSFDYVTHI